MCSFLSFSHQSCLNTMKWFNNWESFDYFYFQKIALKTYAIFPIEFEYYLPKNLKFLGTLLRILHVSFWHVSGAHFGLMQAITVISSFKNSTSLLDEISTAFMMGSIFWMASYITTFFQINYKEVGISDP